MRFVSILLSVVLVVFFLSTSSILAQTEDIVIEAEDFDPTISDAIADSTMLVYDDAAASNGKYLMIRKGGKKKKYVGYKFSTTSATDTTYFLWVKSRPNYGNSTYDRQYINWDVPAELVVPGGGGGFPFQGVSHVWFHNDNANGDTLVWRWRLSSANGPTIKLNLQPGDHTFFIRSRDGSGSYDMIKITNDTTWRPDIMFEFEAESGAVTAPLFTDFFEGASNDSVVATTPGSGTVGQMDLMNGNDDIGVHMDQAPDDFYIWLLVDLPSESANSYWIGVNDEQVVPPSWEGAATAGLEWRRLTDASGDARVYDLPVEAWNAPHILRVKQQEEGTRIDKVLVTNDPSYEPVITGVQVDGWNDGIVARTFEIQQNYPNPFNPSTNIAFYVPESGQAVVSIYNILGQKIVTLLDKKLTAGQHAVIWDARDQAGATVSSGVYFYQIQFNDQVRTAKMILMQ